MSMERVCAHTWFLLACCTFIVYSSLPRIATIVDFVLVVLIYCLHVAVKTPNAPSGSLSDFIKWDLEHYRFNESVAELVVLSLIRSVLLFVIYAYRYQLKKGSFYFATLVMIVSSAYMATKLVLLVPRSAGLVLVIFSLVMSVVEFAIYMGVRRKKIRAPKSGRVAPRGVEFNPAMDDSQHVLPQCINYGATSSEPNYRQMEEGTTAQRTGPSVVRMEDEGIDPHLLADKDSLFADIDSINVHYKLFRKPANEGDGVSIVLLHGFGGSVFSWRRCWDLLCTSPYVSLVVAMDRPGFGLTSRILPSGGRYGTFTKKGSNGEESVCQQENPYTPHYSEHITFGLLDHLNIRDVVLIGHSTGGALALSCSVARPERVRGMVLVSPTIFTEGFPRFIQSMFRTRLGKSLVEQLVRSEIGEVAIRRAWYDAKEIPTDVISNYKNTSRVKNWHEALTELAQHTPEHEFVEEQLDSVTRPVLVLHGNQDKLVVEDESKKAVKRLQAVGCEAQLVPIDECGHVPHEELPHVFMEHVEAFLQKLSPEGGGSDPH